MLGETVSHYRILEKLGGGGMGEVYRARDERLDRDVALKVLPAGTLADETARRRFRKEALTLSQLNHPNIAVVHDFDTQEGVDFLAMEYVAGETLAQKLAAGPLPEKEVVGLAAQIAEALEEAHERDIIHRDLKPGNVMVTPKGRVKVVDFGLAKLVKPVEGDALTAASLAETQAGAVMGTVPYMAPEQLQGQAVDARTDIYALGAVLYEMATGRRPFPEKQASQLIAAILSQPPQPPRELNGQISPGLEAIILKALEKDPARRHQSAKEVLADLGELSLTGSVAVARRRALTRRGVLAAGFVVATVAVLMALNVGGLRDRLLRTVGASVSRRTPLQIHSIAVLPLENLSRDPEQEYFADGMTEALITNLAKIRALKVISRTSVMHFKRTQKTIPEIAKELNVDAVVEGSVQRAGERVRITAQLIHAATDRHVWAESYERDSKDVLSLQNEVARAIAREIQITLSPDEQTRISEARSVNPEAYELYLKGRYHFYQRNLGPQEIRTARGYFEQALQKDPTYAAAYAGLADAYDTLAWRGAIPRAEGLERAMAAATKALELDESLAEAHASLAAVKGDSLDWAGSEREMKRAIELNPNYAQAHSWYANTLTQQGRYDEAIAEARRAVQLDPLARPFTNTLIDALFVARRYDEVIALCGKLIQLDPQDAGAHYELASAYQFKGEHKRAIEPFKKWAALREPDAKKWADENGFLLTEPEAKKYLAGLKLAYSQDDVHAADRYVKGEIERRPKSFPPELKATVYARLGEKDRAFPLLEKMVAERSPGAFDHKVDPNWDLLRSDPRFQALLRRMNFPP